MAKPPDDTDDSLEDLMHEGRELLRHSRGRVADDTPLDEDDEEALREFFQELARIPKP